MTDVPSLGLDEVLARVPGLEVADIEGEVALFSAQKGAYLGLNEVGSRIWALLEEPTSARMICARLLEEYEVAPALCEREVLVYLGALLKLGVVRLTGDS